MDYLDKLHLHLSTFVTDFSVSGADAEGIVIGMCNS